jgi:hypothetical protein
MNTSEDIVFKVTCKVPPRAHAAFQGINQTEEVTFVNISYEKIQEAMREAFESTGAMEEGDAEIFLNELANRLNTKGNTIAWRGKVMKMNFSVE